MVVWVNPAIDRQPVESTLHLYPMTSTIASSLPHHYELNKWKKTEG